MGVTIAWICVGIFGVLVLAGLIYGVVTHKKRVAEEEAANERGFLKDLKFRSSWPPLSLIVDGDLLIVEDRLMEAVTKAAAWWEEQTGKRYFVPPGELVDGGHVVVIMPSPVDDMTHDPNHTYAYVWPWITKDGYVASMSVRLLLGWEDASDEVMINAMKHELGHLLGLAHDEYIESIMFKTASARESFVSEHDKMLLKKTYDV